MQFRDYVNSEAMSLEERRELIVLENVLTMAINRVKSGAARPDGFLAQHIGLMSEMQNDVYNAVERSIHARTGEIVAAGSRRS